MTYWMGPDGLHMITDMELENTNPLELNQMAKKSIYEVFAADYIDTVKPVKKDYNTVGVRFLQGPNLQKVYTYRVRKGAKLRLGQEVVVPTQREVLANTIAVVVELHKVPQDTGAYDYKFVAGTVSPL